MKRAFLLTLLLLLATLGGPVQAEDSVTDIVLAEKLADYGLANQDAEALVMASKIYIRYPSAEFRGGGIEEPDEGATSAAGPAHKEELYQVGELLARARKMTKEDAILARIAQLEKDLEKAGKSPRSGVLRGSEAVRSKHRWSTEVEFIGEEEARVEVLAKADSRLQVVIYDESGEWIAGNKEAGPNCSLSWTVARDGMFKVVVRNRGEQSVPFRFVLR